MQVEEELLLKPGEICLPSSSNSSFPLSKSVLPSDDYKRHLSNCYNLLPLDQHVVNLCRRQISLGNPLFLKSRFEVDYSEVVHSEVFTLILQQLSLLDANAHILWVWGWGSELSV